MPLKTPAWVKSAAGDAGIVQPVEAGVAPPRHVGRHAEVLEQLVLDAEQELVGQRRAVVADAVRVAAERVVRIESGHALEGRELVDVGDPVAVGVHRRVVDVRVVRDRRHRQRRAVRIELRGEGGVAAAHDRLARLVQRIGEADPRRDVVVDDRVLDRRRVERRQQRRAGPGWRGRTPPSTELADAIPPHAGVQRQPVEADRVAEVGVPVRALRPRATSRARRAPACSDSRGDTCGRRCPASRSRT